MSIQHKVNARSGRHRVVSSSFSVTGSRVTAGAAKGSLSNYRLKLTARGRSVADSLQRTRAAA